MRGSNLGREVSITGIWSVDAIHTLAKAPEHLAWVHEPRLVRMVHYTRHLTNPVGIRHLLVPEELIADGDGPSRLDFGRAFKPSWARLRDQNQGVYLLTPDNLGALPESGGVEADLKATIDGAFDESGVVEGGDLPGPFLGPLVIHVLNVGQGDTILLELPNGKFWLVDAFAWTAAQFHQVIRYLHGQGCHQLEKLIISHFHYDHIRRALDILGHFHPKEVWVPVHTHPTSSARNLVVQAGVRLKRLAAPIQFRCGAYALHLAPTAAPPSRKDPNEHGLVLYIEGPGGTALLPGDVPGPLLSRLISSLSWPFPSPRSIYKVTHHCSATGNDPTLFGLIHPSEAATSCAATNRYDHPNKVTRLAIDRLVAPGLHRFTFNHKMSIAYSL